MAVHEGLVLFIGELRRSARNLGLFLALLTIGIFFLSPRLLSLVQQHLADKLYFFSVAGPFLAHVKLSFFCAFYLVVPWFMSVLWRAVGKPFRVDGRQLFLFIFCTCLLFYLGTVFCYFVTLPFGIDFLLGFGSEALKPVISIGRFVNFVTIFVLAFGIVFELPVFMIFSVKVGVLDRAFFIRNRRYALLFISILSALLTPTPDIVNMLLMGAPLYLLYEFGIVLLKVLGLTASKRV
ncbi:MAG: preprotein translocase subunit TatC [Deltaproteobacteria bacterium]|nr:MAG: preprotein translocase subunit TatC [Deltaproteobacteria bacterium]PIE73424.1 MAG: preprotein translocase subunit TatC [Deltaproteobacteria bacterium]